MGSRTVAGSVLWWVGEVNKALVKGRSWPAEPQFPAGGSLLLVDSLSGPVEV
jgi:hypothetical protein